MKAIRSLGGYEKKTSTKAKSATRSNRRRESADLASVKWWRDFNRHLDLGRLRPRTRASYLCWVRQLHEAFPRRDLTKLSEAHVLDFLISLRQERKLKDSTVNQALCALRAFYRDHLGRQWKGWSQIKIRREESLPNVLSQREVAQFLGSVREGRFRALFTLMYHCGLRLGETIHIKPGHIDAARGVIRIVHSKGGKEREVPISPELIERLRAFWKHHRNPEWLFPSPGRGWKSAGATLPEALRRSTKPMSDSSVQAAMRATVTALGWDRRAGRRPVTCHTLRHCFATHLLDEGVSIRLVSQYLGHASLKPTLVYLHLTEVSETKAREVLARFPGL